MRPHKGPRLPCPIYCVIEKLSKKWSLLILGSFMKGKKLRFKEIIDSLPKLNTRILSQRLTELEQEGLIERSVTQTRPITISYEITRKGLALQKVFEHYADWAKTWGISTRCRKCYACPMP
ncbi:MAG: helix-turn-helix domain-containing protein [Candidatus Peribacteraceae bacterium]|nr:helix-turn-helix domain-containing protein [Candidatus Peribacteraceae bacterium]MDD5074461.1 helix-turn-helix domain-containing protein [Candidatus Peribacteraceae bacterium]